MSQDTKRLLTALVAAMAILWGWQLFMRWKWPEWYASQQKPPAADVTPAAATTRATAASVSATTSISATTTAAAGATTGPVGWQARGDDRAGAAAPITLGSAAISDKNYAMAVDLVRRGASINSVVLNQFRKTAEDKVARYTFQEPLRVDGNVRDDTSALQTRTIILGDREIDLGNVTWKLEKNDLSSATFFVDVVEGANTVAKVFKTYTLTPRSDDPNTPQGYQLNVTYRVENLTDKPLWTKMTFNGPTPPPRELERQADQAFIFGYWNEGSIKVFSHLIESEFSKDHTWKEFTRSDKGLPMEWGGAQSAYFNAIVRPVARDPKEAYATWVWKVSATLLNPQVENAEERRAVLRYEADLKEIPAKSAAQADLELYLGPKWRNVLNTAYYSALPREYKKTLVIASTVTCLPCISWVCGLCTSETLINFMVWLLGLFFLITRDWGLAIICLVLLVRAILHPITKRSQVNMMKMQKMGPEMERLKKKYADDKEALAKAQMQFYKQNAPTQILGCLPMFLQMPIWIALWSCLQSTFELRQAPFLYGFTWIKDLSRPDYLIRFSQAIQLPFSMSIHGVNILPLLMGVIFYIQTKFQPKPAAMTPEQETQQKMMTWMTTLLFPIMLYNGPSGLNLYILTSTGFGIIESKVIRRHIKEREELEKLGPTIVDAPPPDKGGKKGKEPAKKGWFERLQEKADQIRKEADKRKR